MVYVYQYIAEVTDDGYGICIVTTVMDKLGYIKSVLVGHKIVCAGERYFDKVKAIMVTFNGVSGYIFEKDGALRADVEDHIFEPSDADADAVIAFVIKHLLSDD